MSDDTGIRKFEERWVFDEVRQASGGEVQGKSLFWHWPGLLSDDVCDLIIKEGKALPQLEGGINVPCLLYTSPSPRDRTRSRMPSSA